MLSYEDVVTLRDDALGSVSDLPVQPRSYQIAGGSESLNPWQAVGFYLTGDDELKLVFELLYFQNRRVAALRVYEERRTESGPAFMFKSLLEQRDPRVMRAAADAFTTFGRRMEVSPDQGDAMPTSLPDELRQLWELAETPVPPPVSLEELQAQASEPEELEGQ